MRIWPPTRMTSLISLALAPVSLSLLAHFDGPLDRRVNKGLELGPHELGVNAL